MCVCPKNYCLDLTSYSPNKLLHMQAFILGSLAYKSSHTTDASRAFGMAIHCFNFELLMTQGLLLKSSCG